ncbi:MAG TPA: winged helix-turn-helix transcriptional regulator [Methylothermaceae bacterium]|nr:winged helix-turn-helix transcriptional regulator [Methylothermaceae bacterium]
MEIITAPVDESRIDELARSVFDEAISVIGGLRKLIEYRNLTWLPSLAEAAYVIVLAEEGRLTHREIAARVGLTEPSVSNILRASPEAVEGFLRRELESVDTHKAGGIAKLAYRRLKSRGFPETVALDAESARILNILWAFNVLTHLRGVDFPVERVVLRERLTGMQVKDRPIEPLLDKIDYPVRTPAELLHKLKQAAEQA